MKASDNCIQLIKQYEGYEPRRYFCPAGFPTIGYGHVIGAKEYHLLDVALTEEQATCLLAADLVRYENAVTQSVYVSLTQAQFDALVSFTFNVGIGSLRSSTLLKKLNDEDYAGARMEFSRWNKAGNKVLPGLTRRRKAEADLFSSKT